MANLNQNTLRALLELIQQAGPQGNQGSYNADLGMLQQPGGGPAWQGSGDLSKYLVNASGIGEDIGGGYTNAYDPEGKFLETQGPQESGKWGGLYPLAKLAAAAAAMYGAGSGLEGLLGAEAGLGAGELTASQLAGEGVVGGSAGGAELGGLEGLISSMGGSPFTIGIEGGALSMPAFGSALPYAGALSGVSQLTSPKESSFSVPSSIKDWLPLAGGVLAGATTNKQGEQTATREPWAPAQPLLKDLLAQGQTLAKQEPFSPYKKQVMEQQAGLLSGINTQALPGLLASLQGLSTPYKRGGQMGAPTLSGLPMQFDPMQIFKRGP
jgi:hypothetical protein